MFSSKSFILFGLKFRCLNHLSLFFCMVLENVLISFFFSCGSPVSQHHLMKRLSLLHCIFLLSLSQSIQPQVYVFVSGLHILFHWCIFLFLCQQHTALNNCRFLVQSDFRDPHPSSSVFFLNIGFAISYKLNFFCFSFVKKAI